MNSPTRSLAFLVALLLPLHALSAVVAPADSGLLRVQDSIAGLGLEAEVEGFAAMGSVDLVVIPPAQNYLIFPLTLDRAGSTHFRVPGTSAEEAGTYHAFVGKNGQRLSPEASFEVLPDTVDTQASTLSVLDASVTADGRDAAAVQVTVTDRYGNPLPGRPVELRSASVGAIIEAEATGTDAQGIVRFAVKATRAGIVALRAVDLLSGMALAQEGTVTAIGGAVGGSPFAAQLLPTAAAADPTFDIADHFEVTLTDAVLAMQDITGITIRAVDANGNTAQDYIGTVRITSTDPQATLPGLSGVEGVGQATFTSRHLGTRFIPFSVSFRTTGKHTVTVEDTTDPAHVIRGEARVVVSSSTGPLVQHLTVTSPLQNGTVNGGSVTVEGATQPYTNIQVKGGTQAASGESDDSGRFAIVVSLDPTHSEYTLVVMDDGGGESTLHLVRDTDPPVVTSATLTPEQPQEGENILIVVQSEPALKSMEFKLGEERISLQEDANRPGTYQSLFTAPRAGEYQPAVEAKDQAGNAANLLVPLTVSAKKMSTVQNLRAEPKNGAVELQWDPVADDTVDYYRVYVGEKVGDYAYTLDTPDASKSAATVTGLSTGMPFVFAVTAVQGDREGDKSNPVTAHVLGIRLIVTPQDEALAIEWSLPVDITFQSFLVEYGVDAEQFSEKRTVPGGDIKKDEKRSLVLRDLLPGVTYAVRITPVDTTGEARDDLVATGQGTPGGDGVHYASPDQIPPFQEDPSLRPPNQTGSGLPHLAWWIAGSVTLFLFLLQWQSRRKLRKAHRFLRMMENRYHSV
ncbi:MAG: Ig-like domain-containing protein [Candidatus Peribacteraceae bacterium]|jgi:hypothetical protein